MAESILVVEDDPLMLAALEILLLDEGYDVTTASSGIEALELARQQNFDLVVSDVQMAEMDGIETLSNLKQQQPATRSIVITGYASPDVPIQAIKMGVDDYILKPFDDRQFVASVKRCLDSYKLQKAYTQGLQQQWRDFSSIIKLLAEGVEERDEHFSGHSRRVATLSTRIAKKLGISRARVEVLELAAFLHDIGSIGQKKDFLSKAEELVKDELQDAQAAASQQQESLFSSVSSLREVFRIILHHHEWFDGTGYPYQLKGEDIPLESRVLCVAEAYDAMISPRPHRSPLTHADARQVLQKESGTHFDPQIVKLALEVLTATQEEEEEGFAEEALSRERQAELMLGLSRTYLSAGDLETAAKGFASALELLPEAANNLRADCQIGLALSYVHRNRLADAKAAAEAAVLAAQNGSQLLQARSRLTLGLAQAYHSQFEAGENAITGALEVLQTWEAHHEIATAHFYRAKLEHLKGGDPTVHTNAAAELIDTHGLHQVLKQERHIAIPLLLRHVAKQQDSKSERLLAWLGWDSVQPFLSDLEEGLREQAMARLGPSQTSGAPQVPPLSIYGFGKFRVFVGGKEVEDKLWKTRKSKYMFAYLAANGGKDVPDEKVMEIFWPDHEPEKARQSLYAALSHMRKALDAVSPGESERTINARKGFYKFNTDRSYLLDIQEFDRLYDQGQARIKDGREDEAMVCLQKAEQLYQGEFMEGYYDDWAVFMREELEMKYVEVLQVLMEHFQDLKKHDVVIDYAQRLLKHDPCQQEAHSALMHSYIQQGKPELAARQYQTCTQIMKNELNMSPSPELTELYLRITG